MSEPEYIYRIFHRFDAEGYKVNFYIRTNLNLEQINDLLLGLQIVHSKLPAIALSDDIIQHQHIARYWNKFRPNDGSILLTHENVHEDAIEVDLHSNWNRGIRSIENGEAFIAELDSKCVGELFLEVEKTTFNGEVLNSPYYRNLRSDLAHAVGLLLVAKTVDGLEDTFGRQAEVTFS